MSEKDALIEKYTGKKYPALVPPPAPGAKQAEDYRALVEHKQRGSNPRFRIVDRKGFSYGCGYAYLLGWLYSPPDLLTIQTTTQVFTIEGRNLERIELALMDEKIRELHEFNPELHNPPEEGQPIIERLEVKNRWEEKP
jgi:hypothetical protein